MLRERLLSAAVGIPAVVALLFLDGVPALEGIPLLLLAAGVAAMGAEEVAALLRGRGYEAPRWLGAILGPLLPLVLYFLRPSYRNGILLLLTLGVVCLVLTACLMLISDVAKRLWRALRDFALVAVGAVYVGGMMAVLLLLRHVDRSVAPAWGMWPVLLVFCATWAMDAAAFLAGRRWGQHRLWPTISPAKTIEGAVFGLISSVVITAVFLSLAINPRPFPLVTVAIGLAVGVAGEGGDLLESRFKRWVGAKNSGDVIPGHGGVLDRFDSLLLAAPVLYVILLLLRG